MMTTRQPTWKRYARILLPAVLLATQLAIVTHADEPTAIRVTPSTLTLRGEVRNALPVLGHRNWIVVADSAYPAQSRAGIKTVYIGGGQATAVAEVLAMVDRAKHVRGVVHVDAELKFVPEKGAPGVEDYRLELDKLLKGQTIVREPHEEIIAKLDEAAKLYRVLILKTDFTVPYTSVFIQLDCGYWSAEQEQQLREAMGE